MSISISYTQQIVAFGKATGRSFTRDEIGSISETMNSVTSLDDTGNIRLNIGAGPVATVEDALGVLSVGMGKPTTTTTSSEPTIPPGSNATARALALTASTRDGRSAARAVEAQALVSDGGNPWDTRSINRTRQALVLNLDAALAARLKQQAGVR